MPLLCVYDDDDYKGSIPIVKRFLGEKVPSKMVHKMALIRGNGVLNIRFYDRDPEKAHHCAALIKW